MSADAVVNALATQRVCEDCSRPFDAVTRRRHKPARWCPNCRWRHRGRLPKKYVLTPEVDALIRQLYDSRVRGRVAEIATRLGWPRWVVTRRAAVLGLTTPWPKDRREWTDDEERFLVHHAGSRVVDWIARKLSRSRSSVVLKLKRMRLSRRIRDGYTMRDLEMALGLDHRIIARYVREGRLRAHRLGTEREHDTYNFTDADVLRFLRDNPTSFHLHRVDQVWFLGLIESGWAAAIRAAEQEQ